MNQGGRMIPHIEQLLELFSSRCAERGTWDELTRMVRNHRTWAQAHDLFDRIRDKTLVAERAGDRALATQYLFEEICAKTLYNMSGEPAPFDPDSPYWVVPIALAMARQSG